MILGIIHIHIFINICICTLKTKKEANRCFHIYTIVIAYQGP